MSSFDRIKFWCPDRLREPVTFELSSKDSLGATLFNDFSYMDGFTSTPDWTITFSSPLQTPITFVMSSALLLEATRCKELSCLIADSEVEGALIAYGEAVQDNLNLNRKND